MKQNCSSTDFVDEILIPTITGLVEQYKVSKSMSMIIMVILSLI